MRTTTNRCGITLAELLVAIGIVGLVACTLLPAVQHARESSRAVSCRHHLSQLALAAQASADRNGCFPYTSTAWSDSRQTPPLRYYSVSPQRGLMAALDSTIFEQIDSRDITDPGWIPLPPSFVSPQHQRLQQIRVAVFLCPSDRIEPGATSYRGNLGISVEALPPSGTIESTSRKGAFVNGKSVPLATFRDGLSNTALFSERVLGDYFAASYQPFQDVFARSSGSGGTPAAVASCRSEASSQPADEFSFAGGSWLLGGWLNTWYNHVLTPNSSVPDCGLGSGYVDGGTVVMTARSFHSGGVNVAMADASVHFISQSVDGQVWIALGTRNGGELFSVP